MDTTPIPQPTPPEVESSKKYIRTFEGDIETFKKGGTPDLEPLADAQHPVVKREGVEEPALVPLKTYAGDFSEKMKETHADTATVLAAEQDSGQRLSQAEEPRSSHTNLLYSVVGAVFVIVGLGGAYFAYTNYYAVPPVVIVEGVQAPIFVDEREEISGAGVVLLQAIEQSVSRSLAPHAVRFLYLASSTDSIFSLLPLSAPDILKRNVNATSSMAGVVSSPSASLGTDGGNSPFFILSVATYRDTFAGMLSWERTMPYDLEALFPSYPPPVTVTPMATTTVSTSSPQAVSTGSTTLTTVSSLAASTTPAFTPGFRDEIVSNHDVRMYRDDAGRSVVVYGYWNQTTLVIARDATAFAEILGRLATSHLPAQAGTQP